MVPNTTTTFCLDIRETKSLRVEQMCREAPGSIIQHDGDNNERGTYSKNMYLKNERCQIHRTVWGWVKIDGWQT